MRECTLMAYNIENMRDLFVGERVRPEQLPRALRLAERIAAIDPDLLGIVEASDKLSHHQAFLALPPLARAGYQVARSTHRRGRQDLAFYYRAPFTPLHVDDAYRFYDDWQEDIDHDGIVEVCGFERRPLEVEFAVTGTPARLRVVLVATKSKGVFSVQDFFGHQHRALANRKRLVAQCKRLRRRVDGLLADDAQAAFVLLGDFNDEPGLDHFERFVGESGIEAVMGSVFEPAKILHNALHHKTLGGKPFWTATYPDMIVANFAPHRAWLDHILLAPALLRADAPIHYVPDSGDVGPEEPDADGPPASDHRPVFCRIRVPPPAAAEA